jgi:hypothetical protein
LKTNGNQKSLVQFHLCSTLQKNQQKHEENAILFDSKKDTFERTGMDKGLKSMWASE